jgi:hypothetical protein
VGTVTSSARPALPGRRRDTLLALAAFVGVAILATYPLIRNILHSLPGGLGDPLLNSTILAWDADRARHLFRGLWDAPYLFPHRRALAYSEHLLGIAIFTAPFDWIGGSPYLAYNVAFIGSYALAGLGMFLLSRDLWGRTDAALLSGLTFALTPYRLGQVPHLQVLMTGWMPIALWSLHHYFAAGRRRWLAGFAAAYVLLGLSNGYYFYFFLFPAAAVIVSELAWPRLPRGRIIVDVIVIGAIAAVAVLPVALPYYQLQREHGFARTTDEMLSMSAHLSDYFRVPGNGFRWGGLLRAGGGELELFQGFVLSVFAVVGVLTLRWHRHMPTIAGSRARAVATYTAIAIIGIWLSMGFAGGPLYGWLTHAIPGFSGLRVPARFASITGLGLAALAGAGFAWTFDRIGTVPARALVLALATIVVVEGQHGVGIIGAPAANEHSWDRVAYEWLRNSPPGGAIELDITQQDDFQVFTTVYALNAVRHKHPIVNGNGGWRSMLQEFLGAAASPLREGQTASVLRGLRAIGVRYVLLHPTTFRDPDLAARIEREIHDAGDQVIEEHRFDDTWAWRLADAAPRHASPDGHPIDPHTFTLTASHHADRLPFLVDGDGGTRWFTGDPQSGAEFIEIDLAEPTDVSRVQLVTTPRSLLDYPRHLTIAAIDASGSRHELFNGEIVDRLIVALAGDEQRIAVDIPLPSNTATTLRIEQTGTRRSWWSLHELAISAR